MRMNHYIVELPVDVQEKVKKLLIEYLTNELGLKGIQLKEEIEIAMSSRLNDLNDTINLAEVIQR